ncbi:MAG: MogA/MoaB family molybdenum cofactor biosynthesis protein [Chloroflexota bacterium]
MVEQTHDHSHRAAEAGAPITVGILTCSDRGARGERADVSGPTIHNLVVDRLGAKVAQYKVVPDDRRAIEATLVEWADDARLDLVFTTGGTGFSPRDVTPEATRAVVDRDASALTQAMLFESLRITPYAMLTRATAGIRKRTLIVNLPGNPKAVAENFDAIAEVLPHAVDIVRGVDTHAQDRHAGHGGQAGHQGHSEPSARTGHADHAGHREHATHSENAEHAGTTAPAGGIARYVGGPPC